jgi:hypothetical protein
VLGGVGVPDKLKGWTTCGDILWVVISWTTAADWGEPRSGERSYGDGKWHGFLTCGLGSGQDAILFPFPGEGTLFTL